MKTISDKIQLNAKVVPEIKQAVDSVKATTRFSREEIAEVAYAHLFGSRDKLIQAKREKIVLAFGQAGISLPFEIGLAC